MKAREVLVGDVVQLPCNCMHKVTEVINDENHIGKTGLVFEHGTTYTFWSLQRLHVRRDAYRQQAGGAQ